MTRDGLTRMRPCDASVALTASSATRSAWMRPGYQPAPTRGSARQSRNALLGL